MSGGLALAESITETAPANGGALALTSVEGLDRDGGIVLIEATESSEQEFLAYSGVDEAHDLVTGILRPEPGAHPQSSAVGVLDCNSTFTGLLNEVCWTIVNLAAEALGDPDAVVEEVLVLLGDVCTGIHIGASTSSVIEHPCIDKTFQLVDYVMVTVCGSTVAETCVANTVDTISDLLSTVCGAIPVPNSGATTPGVPPGVAMCVTKTLGVVDLVMNTACQSTTAATCVTNLIDKIDDTLATACGLVPVPAGGGTTSGLPPGVTTCVVKVLDTVVLVMNTACQSPDAATCATNVLDKINDLVARACSGEVSTASTTADATTTCANLVISTINSLCSDSTYGEQGATECVNMVVETLEDLLSTVCNPERSTSPGSDECIALIDEVLQGAIVILFGVICPNTSPGVADMCYEEVIARATGLINDTINSACQDSVYGEQGAVECANMVMERVNGLIEDACSDDSSATSGEDECMAMIYEAVCPNSPPGVADMCYEEIRDNILAAIPPVSCVTLGLLCEPLPEVCDEAIDPSCVPPPPEDVLTDPCVSLAESPSATDTSTSATFPASTASDSFDPLTVIEEGSPLPRPLFVSEPLSGFPDDRSTVSSYPFALARIENLVQRYDALVALVSSLEVSALKAHDLLASASAPLEGSPELAAALAELETVVSSIDRATDQSSAALSTVPDVDAGLQQSYSAASAGVDPTEDPFYRLLSDVSTDAALQVLELGPLALVVINGCSVRGLELLIESPEFGPYASQLLAVVEIIDAEVLSPVLGFKRLVVQQTVEAPDAGLAAADDSAPPAEQQVPTTQPGGVTCTYQAKANGSTGYYVWGTPGNDECPGFGGDDTFYLKGGDDKAWGGGGDDLFYLGDGADYADGEDGHDIIYGGRGDDVIWGHAGMDSASGQGGEDEFHGGSGEDWADLGSNSAEHYLDQVYDNFWGGAGHDVFKGGYGNHSGNGGLNADMFFDDEEDPDGDRDAFAGNEGRDWADIADRDVYDMFLGQEGNDSCPAADSAYGVPSDHVDLRPGEGPGGPECGERDP